MARNIRWYIPFKSLAGVSCRVNIYDNDWPSYIDPMRLTGAANPFYFEEGNNSDILNDVIRYRTGYIQFVNDGLHDEDSIFPSSMFDRYVEVLYGSDVVFNGYIQVQEFSSELIPQPRIWSFPVISPLGLFSQSKFSNIMPPETVTLGGLLDMALSGTPYTRVYFPNITGTEMSKTVFSLVFSPWGSNYHCSMSATSPKVMDGKTFDTLIEGICKAFGWICHDTPTALIFSSFDYNGNYCYYPVGHIGDNNYKSTDSTPTSQTDLEDYFTPADNNACINSILPETGIEIKYEGAQGTVDFSFDRIHYEQIITFPGFEPYEQGGRWSLCCFTAVPRTGEFMIGWAVPTFDENGKVSTGRYIVAHLDDIGILVSYFSNYYTGEMFHVRVYTKKIPNRIWTVNYNIKTSQYSIGALDDDDYMKSFIRVTTTVADDYVEVTFYGAFNLSGAPSLPDKYLLYFTGISIQPNDAMQPYSQYRNLLTKDNDILPDASTTVPSATVEMPISMYRNNDNMIGTSVVSTKITEYAYLMQMRKELKSKFRIISSPALPYTRIFSYENMLWRMIAMKFNPRDDEFELTMQNSPILSQL